MKKKIRKSVSILLSIAFSLMLLLVLPTAPVNAAVSGDYEYTVSGGNATITLYTGTASSVTVPSKLGGYPVAYIGPDAFLFCDTLQTVTIPSTVTRIDDTAFYGCENLKKVTIGSGVQTIGTSAFQDCPNLTSVVFSEGLKQIGECAFSYTGLTSVSLPASLSTLVDNPFSGCSSLKTISVSSSSSHFWVKSYALCSKDGTRLICYPLGRTASSYSVPSGTVTVGCDAFSGSGYLSSVVFPSSVKTIESLAFYDCDLLGSITLPSSLLTIGRHAFSDCVKLTSVTIPASLSSFGGGAFSGCTSLTSFSAASGNSSFSSKDGVLFNKSQTKILAYPCGKASSSYTAAGTVTAVGEYAFEGAVKLVSVSIPGLQQAGEGAFSDCAKLSSFTIPNHLKTISNGMFSDCDALKTVTIPSTVTKIESWAYYGCSQLDSVTIPESVTYIGEEAFSDCSSSLVIYCKAGSQAAAWAQSEGIAYDLGAIPVPAITALKNTVTGVKITWSKATGAVKYAVYRKGPGETSFKKIATTTALTYTDQNVEAGKEYRYSVRSVVSDGTMSAYAAGKTIKYVLQAPVISSAANTTSGVKLTWGKVTGAAKYAVYRKGPGETGFTKIATVTTLTYTDKTVAAGKEYRYSVRAVAPDGTLSAYAAGKTIRYVLQAPVISSAVNTATGVKITWGKVTGAAKYAVYRKGPGETGFTKIATVTTLTHTDKNVTAGKEYRYSVRAVAPDGTMSAYSAGKTIKYNG